MAQKGGRALPFSGLAGMQATTMWPPLGELAAFLATSTLPPPTVLSTWSIHNCRGGCVDG